MPNFYRGYHTETAGTAIIEAIPFLSNTIPRIMKFCYEAGATEHTATIMRPIASTTTTEASESGTSTLELDSIDPGKTTADVDEALAASDWVGWICENNMAHCDSISSVTGNQITLANALTTDVPSGRRIWCFYEVGRSTHIQVKLAASTRVEIEGPIQAGYDEQQGQKSGRRSGAGDILLFHVDNITAAGKLHWLWGNYVDPNNFTAG